MTNAEKYLKEDVGPSNLIESFIRYYYKHKEEEDDLGKSFVKYMNEKTRPPLSKEEESILRGVNDAIYTVIGRDKDGDLYFDDDEDHIFKAPVTTLFGHLFTFIKKRRRI